MGLNAITFIADHLGSTAPKVQGHYYYVDFILNVTKGATASVTTTVDYTAATNTILRKSGTALNASTTYTVGSTITLGSSATGGNDGEVTIVSIDGANTMVVSALGTNATDDEITIVGNNFTLVASDLGLSRLSHIEVMAQENNLVQLNTKLTTAGALQNTTSSATVGEYLLLEPSTLSTGAVVAGDIGTFRVRAYGLL
tara:strand:+ start:14347 stop:14943 length:597 start_codon:yes stop_codon:yes gene_type:complete